MLYRLCVLLVLFAVGCKPLRVYKKEFLYLNQGRIDSLAKVDTAKLVQYIQKGDNIQINVFSETPNQQQADVFNLPNNQGANENKGFIVDDSGLVRLPIIGKVLAEGLSRKQLEANLKLLLEPYVARPDVKVSFLRYPITVIGEARPGQIQFLQNRPTMFDLIAAAGDLRVDAVRNDVLIIRQEGLERKTLKLDLTHTDVFSQEGFYLQQNDMVYFYPNNRRLRQNKFDGSFRQNFANFTAITGVLFIVFNLVTIFNRTF